MSEWYETFFDALAFDVWRALVPGPVTEAEATFLLRHLAPTEGRRRLLDVPSGDGRLALPVAAAGHDVVAVDRSPVAVERLRRQMAASGTAVTVRSGDMRDLDRALAGMAPFDGAWCMGNSFGYLGALDTRTFVEGLAGWLRPGARFVLDAAIVAECVLPALGGDDRYEVGDAVLVSANSYDARSSAMVTEMTLRAGSREDKRVVRHRVMTCREIVDLLEEAGLAVEGIYGGLDGEEFGVGAPRCLVVATRRV
ncbi:MAG: class I SAM-dependent methyltransferase [Actinomycetota bacterium]|nr:class I SAM-dependent methyltransferase [Actinomycetota bacterium]